MKLATRTFKNTKYYITSAFGTRTSPITGKKEHHDGCDYGTNGQNWKQYALEHGFVTLNSKDSHGAIIVRISYPRLGISLLYAHLKVSYVKINQVVGENTVIGLTGATGAATGVHLHLGLLQNNKYVDPEKYNYVAPAVIMGESNVETNITSYQIRKGDTLSSIAKKFGTTVKKLTLDNNIENPNFIVAGKRLKIILNKDIVTYKIKKGDTLTRIAKAFGTTVDRLVKLNNIKDKNKIIAGSTIKIYE